MTEHTNLPRLRLLLEEKREELKTAQAYREDIEKEIKRVILTCVCLEEVIKTLEEDDFMPFGKYTGKRLQDLPREYVQVLLRDYAANKDLLDKLRNLHSLEADDVT